MKGRVSELDGDVDDATCAEQFDAFIQATRTLAEMCAAEPAWETEAEVTASVSKVQEVEGGVQAQATSLRQEIDAVGDAVTRALEQQRIAS